MMPLAEFPQDYFRRQDESDDSLFYSFPRLVVHIDQQAINALQDLFRKVLPPGGVYLDLMSSWRSHIPPELKPAGVVGLGMNAAEMADNPQLDDYIVHNLNTLPRLPYDDQTFDAVMCTVSVQYLVRPVAIFAEVYRVLKPGGSFVVSFSNRCFPNKAVRAWLSMTDRQHISLVERYFELSAEWTNLKTFSKKPIIPMQHDPLYAVWASKPSA